MLQTRAWPKAHPDLNRAMHICCTTKSVGQMNDLCLNQLQTELYEFEAINTHPLTKKKN